MLAEIFAAELGVADGDVDGSLFVSPPAADGVEEHADTIDMTSAAEAAAAQIRRDRMKLLIEVRPWGLV